MVQRAVEVVALLASPVHRYAGRPRDGAGPLPPGTPSESREQVEVRAGHGVVGDRYAGRPAHLRAAVSLLDVEALEAVARELGVAPFDPLLARRTVVLRGADVAGLRGRDLLLDSGDGPVRLRGGRWAQPCAWMDAVLAPGAHRLLRGRGGLRCEPRSSGLLRVGPAVLTVLEQDVDEDVVAGSPT